MQFVRMHEFLAREREFFEGEVALSRMRRLPYRLPNGIVLQPEIEQQPEMGRRSEIERQPEMERQPEIERQPEMEQQPEIAQQPPPQRHNTPENERPARLDLVLPDDFDWPHEFERNREEFDDDASTDYNSNWGDEDDEMPADVADIPRSPSPAGEPDDGDKRICCPICYENPFANLATTTICGHVYCRRCIRRWVLEHQNCPTCRTPQRFHQCIELHY